MKKKIDILNKTADYYNVDTGKFESEIIELLKKNVKVIFHSAIFNNKRYVFTGSPDSRVPSAITVTDFRKKLPNENLSIEIS